MCPSGAYKAFTTKVSSVGQIPVNISKWGRKQQELSERGMQSSKIANFARDKRLNCDLEVLKKLGGPFTAESQVDEYMIEEIVTNDGKNKRLYLENVKQGTLHYTYRLFPRQVTFSD